MAKPSRPSIAGHLKLSLKCQRPRWSCERHQKTVSRSPTEVLRSGTSSQDHLQAKSQVFLHERHDYELTPLSRQTPESNKTRQNKLPLRYSGCRFRCSQSGQVERTSRRTELCLSGAVLPNGEWVVEFDVAGAWTANQPKFTERQS